MSACAYIVVINVNILEIIQPECGNNILEEGEECDGKDLGDETCPQHHGIM